MNASIATTSQTPKPIQVAKTRVSGVEKELAVAGAELHLVKSVLDRSLPNEQKRGDVGRALSHTATVEDKVNQAAEELHEVTELLEEEVAQRHRLEAELARRPPA